MPSLVLHAHYSLFLLENEFLQFLLDNWNFPFFRDQYSYAIKCRVNLIPCSRFQSINVAETNDHSFIEYRVSTNYVGTASKIESSRISHAQFVSNLVWDKPR